MKYSSLVPNEMLTIFHLFVLMQVLYIYIFVVKCGYHRIYHFNHLLQCIGIERAHNVVQS